MKIIDCVQGTEEWKAARCGRITASRIVDVMSYKEPSAAKAKELGHKLVRDAVAAGVKGEESQDRANYRTEIIAERLTGVTDDSAFQTKWLREGRENEPIARTVYELANGVFIDPLGFAVHSALEYSGASPDGLVGSEGCLEIKCPKTTTHLKWMEAGVAPEDHMLQMQWEMACCERPWCDFVSFDPRMVDESLRLFQVRVTRNDDMIRNIVLEVMLFEQQTVEQIARIRAGLHGQSVCVVDDGVCNANILQSLHSSIDEAGDARA